MGRHKLYQPPLDEAAVQRWWSQRLRARYLEFVDGARLDRIARFVSCKSNPHLQSPLADD